MSDKVEIIKVKYPFTRENFNSLVEETVHTALGAWQKEIIEDAIKMFGLDAGQIERIAYEYSDLNRRGPFRRAPSFFVLIGCGTLRRGEPRNLSLTGAQPK